MPFILFTKLHDKNMHIIAIAYNIAIIKHIPNTTPTTITK